MIGKPVSNRKTARRQYSVGGLSKQNLDYFQEHHKLQECGVTHKRLLQIWQMQIIALTQGATGIVYHAERDV